MYPNITSEKGKEKMPSIYRPLISSRKEIRLLRILTDTPNSQETQGAIHHLMHYEYLDEVVQYQALSYTWQDASLGEEFNHPNIRDLTVPIGGFIFLNGQRINNTPNLWVVLWQFRYNAQDRAKNLDGHHLKLQDWRRLVDGEDGLVLPQANLWIDALFINEMDEEEKGHQVRMMGEIYKRAEYVHAWLPGIRGDT